MSYLKSYEDTLLQHYYANSANHCRDYDFSRHHGLTEDMRAKLIDWVLHCTHICKIEEKNIFFLIVDLIDLYY